MLEIIQNRPDLSLFYEAIIAAGLDSDLKGPGPFTVMAPYDEAMKQLSDEVLAGLTDGAAAKDFVNAHVSAENLDRDALIELDDQKISFEDGVERLVTVTGLTITIDDAEVLADPAAELVENGIVHTLNKTLIPPTP